MQECRMYDECVVCRKFTVVTFLYSKNQHKMKTLLVLVTVVTFNTFVLCDDELDENFYKCDFNKDSMINIKEWRNCISPSAENAPNVDRLFHKLDGNKDESLSLHEFYNLMQAASASMEENVDIIARDGSKKSVGPKDFLKLVEDGRKGLKLDENGQLSRTSGGSYNIDEIPENDKEIRKYVHMGKWAHRMIVDAGFSTGDLINMQSLVNNDAEKAAYLLKYSFIHPGSQLQTVCQLSVQKTPGSSEIVKYEVCGDKSFGRKKYY